MFQVATKARTKRATSFVQCTLCWAAGRTVHAVGGECGLRRGVPLGTRCTAQSPTLYNVHNRPRKRSEREKGGFFIQWEKGVKVNLTVRMTQGILGAWKQE